MFVKTGSFPELGDVQDVEEPAFALNLTNIIKDFVIDILKNPEEKFELDDSSRKGRKKKESEYSQASLFEAQQFQNSEILTKKILERIEYIRLTKTLPRLREESQGDWCSVEGSIRSNHDVLDEFCETEITDKNKSLVQFFKIKNAEEIFALNLRLGTITLPRKKKAEITAEKIKRLKEIAEIKKKWIENYLS